MISEHPTIYNTYNAADTLVSSVFHPSVYKESIFQNHNLPLTDDLTNVVLNTTSSGLAYWVLGIGLLFLSIIHLLFGKRLVQSISAFFMFRKLKNLGEEGFLLMHPVQYSFMFFYLALMAVFIQSVLPLFGSDYVPFDIGIYAIALLIWAISKILLYFLSGAIYNTPQMGRLLIVHYATYMIVASYLILAFLLSFLLYDQSWLAYTLLVVLFVMWVFRFFYSFWIVRYRTNFSGYQIFIYLCALEIAPASIVLKLVVQYVISF